MDCTVFNILIAKIRKKAGSVFLKLGLLGSFIIISGCEESFQKKVVIPLPNVIFILADDLGYSELGSYGNSFNETPVLDSLAKNGIRFTSAYAAAPVCSPYRAALMTGQHPARLGITDYLRPHGDEHLNENLTTIAEIFKQKGYVTGMVGKWHLSGYEKNGAKASPPGNHGFDEVILTEKRGISGGSYNYPYHFNQDVAQRINPDEYLTDRVNLEAVDFIKRNKDKPFFLYKSHYAVHTNLNGKKDLVEHFSKKPEAGLSPESSKNNVHLAAQLKSIDEGVGMIVKELDSLGLLNNTLLIFTSDNGGETNVTSNAPLRAGKSTLFEGGIREPLIMYWPEKIKESRVEEQPTVNTDFFPTFTSLLGMETEQKIDGFNILPVIEKNEKLSDNRTLYWHYPLDAPHFLGGFSSGAIRDGDYKLIENFTTKELMLFHLKEDIGESNDLSESLPDIRDSLLTKLRDWRKSLDLEVQPHTKSRGKKQELPEPSGPEISLETNGKPVPYLNYGVKINPDGSLIFSGNKNFLKLLPLYIPDVTAKGVELGAMVVPETKNGVLIAHGEEVFGLALYLEDGKPVFGIRKYGELFTIKSEKAYTNPFQITGKLSKEGIMSLFIDGYKLGEKNIGESLPIPPDDPYSIGMDFRRLIGKYDQENFFKGTLSEITFKTSQ